MGVLVQRLPLGVKISPISPTSNHRTHDVALKLLRSRWFTVFHALWDFKNMAAPQDRAWVYVQALAPVSASLIEHPVILWKHPEPSPYPHLRQPDVFLKTVVHSASRGLESSLGSRSQPEWGTMTSWVSVCRPWSMMTIFRGS